MHIDDVAGNICQGLPSLGRVEAPPWRLRMACLR
jgi:hypothetical protein